MSKETIEEAAEKYFNDDIGETPLDGHEEIFEGFKKDIINAFKAGASWQQSQSIPAPVEEKWLDYKPFIENELNHCINNSETGMNQGYLNYKKVVNAMNHLMNKNRVEPLLEIRNKLVDSEPVYKWVKASKETPPEGKLFNMNLSRGGPCLGYYRKTYDTIDVEKYGEVERNNFSKVEWLKEINQPVEDKLQKAIDWCDEKINFNMQFYTDSEFKRTKIKDLEEIKKYLQQLNNQ